MHSGDIRLVKAAKRTFRAEAMLVLFSILITSWSMFALYKISTGWDGSISTLFGFAPVTTTLGNDNLHPKSMSISTDTNNNNNNYHNNNISRNDLRKVLISEQHIVPVDSNYATGQATILTNGDMAQQRLIPNLVELIEANNQLDDEDASTMETGSIGDKDDNNNIINNNNNDDLIDDKQASGSQNHAQTLKNDIMLFRKPNSIRPIVHAKSSPDSLRNDDILLKSIKNRRNELANQLALENYRLAEMQNSNAKLISPETKTDRIALRLTNMKRKSGHDSKKNISKLSGDEQKINQNIDQNEQQQQEADRDIDADQYSSDISPPNKQLQSDAIDDSNLDSNDSNQTSNDDSSDETNAQQAGLAIDDEVDKLTKPSLEFSNQEEDSEYGNEAVRFDDNPNTNSNQDDQHETAANKNKARHHVRPDFGAESDSNMTTLTTTSTTTTPKPSIRSSPQHIVQLNNKNNSQQQITSQDLNFDHNKPAISLMNHIKPRKQQQQQQQHLMLSARRLDKPKILQN